MIISLQAQPFCKKENLFGETVFLEGSPRNDNAATNCLYSVVKGNDIIEIYSDKLVWFEAGKSFTKQWINTSKNAVTVPQNKTNYYFTGGNKSGKQFGFKKLTFKNIYPNIDLIYELINGELKYSFDLHKNAKIEDIQFEIQGVDKIQFSKKTIEFSIDSSHWEENGIQIISAGNAKIFKENSCNFRKINVNTFGFELKTPSLAPPFIIDPFIKKTTSLTANHLSFQNQNSSLDLEYDFDGNLYIYGGSGIPPANLIDSSVANLFDIRYNNYYKIAKYSKMGQLIWVFKGYDTTSKFIQTDYPTGISVNKTNQEVYCLDEGTGIHVKWGFYPNYKNPLYQVIQLNYNGTYGNFRSRISNENIYYNSYLNNNSNSKIICNGYSTNGLNFDCIVDFKKDQSYTQKNPTTYFKSAMVNAISSNQFNYGVYFKVNQPIPNIEILKFTNSYNNIWKTDSFSLTSNSSKTGILLHKPESLLNGKLFASATANLMSTNDSLLTFFDGKSLRIYKNRNGKTIFADSIIKTNKTISYGVAIDPCNNIFIAGDSSKIYCYHLKDTMLTLQKTLTIDNYKHRYLFDVEYDAQRNLIYATGDSILASVQSPFSCIDSSMATVLDSTNNICWQPIVAGLKKQFSESVYSFEWIDTTINQVVRSVNKLGNATDTLANPLEGHTYRLRIMKNKTNLGVFKDLYFNVLKSSKDTLTFNLCTGDSFVHKRNKKVYFVNSAFNDTLNNALGCDSVVTYKLVFHPTFLDSFQYKACMGDTLKFGNRHFTSSAFYFDTLKSIWGCDSLVFRNIHFHGSRDTQNVHICRGSNFKIGTHSYWLSGFYRDTFVNYKNCDSIICTYLTVHRDTSYWLKHTICQGDSLKIAGKYRKSIGDFTDSFKGVWGCDSVIKHQLIVNQINHDTIKLHLCKNQKIVINGKTYASNANFTETYKNRFGCDSTVNYIIKQSNMIADFDIDTSQNPMLIFKNKSIGNTKFFWDFGDETTDSINKDPSHTYNTDQTHFVKICLSIVDSFGCNDTICQTVEISKLVYWLFNSFSPGNDGYNDIFKIGHKGGTFNYNMMVYNRWGALVFETKDANIKDESRNWNGKVMNTGADCPSGSYFVLYQLYVNGQGNPPKEVHGVITLVK